MTDFLRKTGLSLATATVALCGMTSCSGDDDNTSELPIEQPGVPEGYTVCIHAILDDGDTRAVSFDADGVNCTSTFSAEDRVYVFSRGDAYGNNYVGMLKGYLTPTNISPNGKSCDFVGTIYGRFYLDHRLLLAYNLNQFDDIYGSADHFHFDYGAQTGAASTVIDGAIAEVGISDYIPIQDSFDEIPVITEVATFQNVQSMFRQRLTFKDANNNTVTPNIRSLRIRSRYSLNNQYKPMYEAYRGPSWGDHCEDGGILINNPVIDTNGDIYLSLRFKENTDEALTFTVEDDANNVYEIAKAAPSGGFKTGKYYHGSMTLPLVRNIPYVTDNNNNGASIMPDYNNRFQLGSANDPINITISGVSNGFYFSLGGNGSVVTLSNLTATYDGSVNYFIYANDQFTFDIQGTNSITTINKDACIYAPQNCGIKLKGNGSLTLTVKGDFPANYCGLFADLNYNGWNNQSGATEQSVNVTSLLAADGYTVTRSARKENKDGSYTWTYTVSQIQQ